MAWPHPPDYNEAVQNPRHCFADPELQQGQPALNALGLPWPRSGNSADVYKLTCPNDQVWAVKCFTREVRGLHDRYQAISDHLQKRQLPFMVEFHYLDQGIRIRGNWYPIVKMRWVEGLQLNELVKEYIDKPQVLQRLAQMWVRLAEKTRRFQITHGDLQHGNVMLVPGRTPGMLRLRLVDYDGLVVPALADARSDELGHPNYQHPHRLREGITDADADRFSHLVIYTALRCLIVAGRPLWEKHDNSENLLFREKDFQDPAGSPLFRDLAELNDPEIWALVGQLLLASQGPLDQVPRLQDLLAEDGKVPPLAATESARAERCLAFVGPASSRPDEWPAGSRPHKSQATETIRTRRGTVLEALERTKEVPRESLVEEAPPAPAVSPACPSAVAGFGQFKERIKATTHWSDRAFWTVTVGLGALAAALMLGAAFGIAGLAWSSATDPQDVNDAPPTVVTGVTLKPGEQQTLQVQVRRQGYAGPVEVRLEELPPGVTVAPITVPRGRDTAELTFLAAKDAPDAEKQARVSARYGAQQLDAQPVAVVVLGTRKVAAPWKAQRVEARPIALTIAESPQPRLLPVSDVTIRAGEELTLDLLLENPTRFDPVDVALEGVPPKLTWKVLKMAQVEERHVISVQLRAPVDAPEAQQRVQVIVQAGDHKVAPQVFNVAVQPKPRMVQLLPVRELVVPAGQRRILKVELDRQGYRGALEVQVGKLPAGLSCRPAIVLPEVDTAMLEVQVADEARQTVIEIELWAVVNDRPSDVQKARITIDKPELVGPTRPAPTPGREEIVFSTPDGVQLAGTWYPSKKHADAPCVLLLHDVGSSQASWERLALALQERDFAVLTFDFRGHGESTAVNEAFWRDPINVKLARGNPAKPKDRIAHKDFDPRYLPVLINDIAAARMAIDRKNDEGECNSRKLVIMGAQQGATLGTLWLYTEWHRFEINPRTGQKVTSADGRRIVGACWLSLNPKLGGRAVPAADWLVPLSLEKKVPMTFLYGTEDPPAADFVRELSRQTKASKVFRPFTDKPLRTREAGTLLLPLGTCERTLIECAEADARTGASHQACEVERRAYCWMPPRKVTTVIAKTAEETTMRLVPLEDFGVMVP
ncbi:MAG: alpha/beta hydrolase [Gemmataceae bacterium]|nr:alpha/beta hydrolase [Gemmataceae bacterium]